eukprot:1499195-Pyramimonas_sp.AAC.1
MPCPRARKAHRKGFLRRLKAGGNPEKDNDREFDWPVHQLYQTTVRLPYLNPLTKETQQFDVLKPFTVLSGNRNRPMSTTNCWAGEKHEDRVASSMAGKEPDRGEAFKVLQRHAKGDAWLGHQMLQ